MSEGEVPLMDKSQRTTIRKVAKTYRIARISIFSALCVIGSFIHPPSPIQTVAFDSSPGFFAALYFGAIDGLLVTGMGHMITSVVNGLPLGVLHLPIALGMASAGGAMGLVNGINYRWGFIPAAICGITINTALFVTAIPALGWTAAVAFAPFLLLASTMNGAVASLAYVSVRGRLRA